MGARSRQEGPPETPGLLGQACHRDAAHNAAIRDRAPRQGAADPLPGDKRREQVDVNRVLVTRAGASQRLRYGPSRRRERGAPTTRCSLAVVVSSAFVGAVIASRCSRNPVGWFFVVSAVTAAMSEATFRYAVYGLIIAPGSLPLARAMAWPEPWMWLVSIVLILL